MDVASPLIGGAPLQILGVRPADPDGTVLQIILRDWWSWRSSDLDGDAVETNALYY